MVSNSTQRGEPQRGTGRIPEESTGAVGGLRTVAAEQAPPPSQSNANALFTRDNMRIPARSRAAKSVPIKGDGQEAVTLPEKSTVLSTQERLAGMRQKVSRLRSSVNLSNLELPAEKSRLGDEAGAKQPAHQRGGLSMPLDFPGKMTRANTAHPSIPTPSGKRRQPTTQTAAEPAQQVSSRLPQPVRRTAPKTAEITQQQPRLRDVMGKSGTSAIPRRSATLRWPPPPPPQQQQSSGNDVAEKEGDGDGGGRLTTVKTTGTFTDSSNTTRLAGKERLVQLKERLRKMRLSHAKGLPAVAEETVPSPPAAAVIQTEHSSLSLPSAVGSWDRAGSSSQPTVPKSEQEIGRLDGTTDSTRQQAEIVTGVSSSKENGVLSSKDHVKAALTAEKVEKGTLDESQHHPGVLHDVRRTLPSLGVEAVASGQAPMPSSAREGAVVAGSTTMSDAKEDGTPALWSGIADVKKDVMEACVVDEAQAPTPPSVASALSASIHRTVSPTVEGTGAESSIEVEILPRAPMSLEHTMVLELLSQCKEAQEQHNRLLRDEALQPSADDGSGVDEQVQAQQIDSSLGTGALGVASVPTTAENEVMSELKGEKCVIS